MAIKYHRNAERPAAPIRRQTPWMRQGRPIGRMSRRQAMFVIACFLLSAGLLSQLASRRGRLDPYARQPAVRGEGVIVHKAPLDAGAGMVDLEVTAGSKNILVTDQVIAGPHWEELEVGERLTVVYQVHPDGTALRILECGIVALPDRIR